MLFEKEITQQEANKKIDLNGLENKLKSELEKAKFEKERLSLIVTSIDKKL